jgi:Gram-negative bacterial TonB protein C-terminal
MTTQIHLTRLVAAVLVAASCGVAAAQDSAPNSSVKPPCVVAADEKYAYATEQPVQVGGSPAYGAARQRRYLDALRGPGGETVQYRRVGQFEGGDGTILDGYEVIHAGREKPVRLYLDWYHYNAPKAPHGFTCAGPIALGVPPLDPFLEMDDLMKLAITQGSDREFTPIPIAKDGTVKSGVIYDRFRLFALTAHAAPKDAKPDPERMQPEAMQQGLVYVAYPTTCSDRTIKPTAIDILAANGAVMPKERQRQATGTAIARLLHGAPVPPDSFAIAVPGTVPRGGDVVRITYDGAACDGDSDKLSAVIAHTAPRPLEMPQPPLPAGAAAEDPVLLQAVVDIDGAIQRASYVGGPRVLLTAATDAVARWRFEPARVNGVPIASGVLLQVRFVAAR